MGLDYRVRTATASEQDADAYCRLFNSLYRRKATPAYYRWRFFEAPFPSFTRFVQGSHGELLATYGMHVLPFGRGDVSAGLAVDIMVARQFQRQGIFRSLVADVERFVTERHRPAWLYVMGNERAYHAHTGKTGWTCPLVLTSYAVSPERAVEDVSRPLCFEVTPVTQFGEEFDGLFDDFLRSHPHLAAVRRDASYLQWRYILNPWRRYRLLRFERDGRLVAYAALKTFRAPEDGTVYGDIVDLVWRDDDEELLAAVLRHALVYFAGEGAAQAVAWLQTNTVLDDVGRSAGFEPTEQKRYLCARALDRRCAWVGQGDRWFTTLSDSEIY